MLKNWQAKQEDVDAIAAARRRTPSRSSGPTSRPGWVMAFVTDALSVRGHARGRRSPNGRREGDFFSPNSGGCGTPAYRLEVTRAHGVDFEVAYAFGPALGPLDDYLLVEGSHSSSIGAWARSSRATKASMASFAFWAPTSRVSVVGDFNQWDGRKCQMRKRIDSGLWEILSPISALAGLQVPDRFRRRRGQPLKAAPSASRRNCGLRPPQSSLARRITPGPTPTISKPQQGEARRRPISIFEVHLGSWRRATTIAF